MWSILSLVLALGILVVVLVNSYVYTVVKKDKLYNMSIEYPGTQSYPSYLDVFITRSNGDVQTYKGWCGDFFTSIDQDVHYSTVLVSSLNKRKLDRKIKKLSPNITFHTYTMNMVNYILNNTESYINDNGFTFDDVQVSIWTLLTGAVQHDESTPAYIIENVNFILADAATSGLHYVPKLDTDHYAEVGIAVAEWPKKGCSNTAQIILIDLTLADKIRS